MKELAFFPPVLVEEGETTVQAAINAIRASETSMTIRELTGRYNTDIPFRRNNGLLEHKYKLFQPETGRGVLLVEPNEKGDKHVAIGLPLGEEFQSPSKLLVFVANRQIKGRRYVSIISELDDNSKLLLSIIHP